jgi:hypothetical protein
MDSRIAIVEKTDGLSHVYVFLTDDASFEAGFRSEKGWVFEWTHRTIDAHSIVLQSVAAQSLVHHAGLSDVPIDIAKKLDEQGQALRSLMLEDVKSANMNGTLVFKPYLAI